MPLAPRLKTKQVEERVLDARVCLLSGCRFLQASMHPLSRQTVYACGAGVYRAHLPADELQAEVARNPHPQPGHDGESNPFLLRLLMAPECLRPECGIASIQYTERVLEVDPEENETELFL